jgi:hypothetical protein
MTLFELQAWLGHYVGDFVNPVAAKRGWGSGGKGLNNL